MGSRHFKYVTAGAGALVLGLLFWNRLPGLGFFDASEYALHMKGWGIPHAPGYPVFTLAGKLLCLLGASPFLAQQLVSLVSLAAAAILVYTTFAPRGDDAPEGVAAACLSAAALFSAFHLQLFTVLPEVFVSNVAVFAFLGWAIRRWLDAEGAGSVFWIFLAYGLGLAHHHTLALTVPALVVVLIMARRSLPAGRTLLHAGAGLALGALPLVYLPLASAAADPAYTYYRVDDLFSFIFVMLRKGYGTFQLTKVAETGSAGELTLLSLGGLARSFHVLLFLVPVGLFPFRASLRERHGPLVVYALVTIALFFTVFTPMANMPTGIEYYDNFWYRFVTIPALLVAYLLYPGFLALLRWTGRRGFLALAFAGLLALVLGVSLTRLPELRFRAYDPLDRHIAEGYRTIFRKGEAPPRSGAVPRNGKCAIFARPDSLVFSLWYYNEHVAERGCFIFWPGSFADQFVTKNERLLVESFPEELREQWKAEFAVSPLLPVHHLFLELKKRGYGLYVFYQPDFAAGFADTIYSYRPKGNILELTMESDAPLARERLANEYAGYVRSIEDYVSKARRAPRPRGVVDNVAASALFQNLGEYRVFYGSMFTDIASQDTALVGRAVAVENEVAALYP